MWWPASFFVTMWRSCTDLSFYGALRTREPSKAWSYFLQLLLLLAFAYATTIAVIVASFDLHGFIGNRMKELQDAYPEELVITLADQRIDINQPRPYRIEIPVQWQEFMEEEAEDEYAEWGIATFVNDEDLDLSRPEKYKSLLIAGETRAFFYNPDEGEITVIPIDEMDEDDEFVVTKADIDEWASLAVTGIHDVWFFDKSFYVTVIFFVVTFGVFVGTFMLRLFQLLVFAFIAWLIAVFAWKKAKLKYGEVFLMSMHTLTPVMLLVTVDSLFGLEFWNAWLTIGVYLVFSIVCMPYVGGLKSKKSLGGRP